MSRPIEFDDIEMLDIETVREESRKIKAELDKEITFFKREKKVDGVQDLEKPLTSEDQLWDFMQKSFARLNEVGSAAQELESPTHRKSPTETAELLTSLANQQDRFLVEMKVAQLYLIQLVIEGYDKIQQEEATTKDPEKIIAYNTQLSRNLERLENMPSLERFETANQEIGKLISARAKIEADSKQIAEGQMGDGNSDVNTATRVLAAGASQAFRENVNFFGRYIDEITGSHLTQNVESHLDDMAKEPVFTGMMQDAFKQGLIVQKEIRSGAVTENQDFTDRALLVAKTVVSQIPVPIVASAASTLASIAQVAHTSTKEAANRNRDNFAQNDLAGQIIAEVSRRAYEHYSQERDDQPAVLDTLSTQGQLKFADEVTKNLVYELGHFKITPEDKKMVESFRVDDERLKSDKSYCEELSKRCGIEINQDMLKQETYRHNIATSLESKMCVDFFAQRLTQSLEGKTISTADFAPEDFAKPKDYLEKSTKAAVDLLEQQRAQGQSPFGKGSRLSSLLEQGVDKVVEALAQDYLEAKKKDPSLDHEKFLKDSELINSGGHTKTTIGLTGVTKERTPERENFRNVLLPVLSEFLDAAQRDQFDKDYARKAKLTRSEGVKDFAPVILRADKERDSSKPDPLETISVATDMAHSHISKFAKDSQISGDQTKAQIEQETKDLQEKLGQIESGLKWRPFKKILNVVTFGTYAAGGKKAFEEEDKQRADLGKAIAQNNEKLKGVDPHSAAVATLAGNFEKEIKAPTTVRSGVSLDKLVRDAKEVAHSIDSDTSVISASRSNSQKSNFSDLAEDVFEGKVVVSQAVVDGKVGAGLDRTDRAIQVATMVAGQVSVVPVVGAAISLVLTGAQYANDMKKTQRSANIANFGSEEESRKKITEIASKVYDLYSIKVDGKPTIFESSLTEKGQAKFIGSIVSTVLEEISKDPSRANDVDALIGSAIGGMASKKGTLEQMFGQRNAETLTMRKISFDPQEDFKPGVPSTFNVTGLRERPVIVTKDGVGYCNDERLKDAKAGEFKYGFRMATEAEEKAIEEALKSGKKVPGYTSVGEVKVERTNEVNSQGRLGMVTAPGVDPYARIDAMKLKTPEQLEELREFQDSKKRVDVLSLVPQMEKTDAVNATVTMLSMNVSLVTAPLSSMFSTKSSQKSEEAQTLADQAVVKCDKAKGELATNIREDQLKPEFRRTGVENALTSFVEGFHAQVMDGATQQELNDFARAHVPVTNPKLIKQLVDLAVDYSEAKVAKAVENKVARGMGNGEEVIGKFTKDVIEAVHEAERGLKGTGLHELKENELRSAIPDIAAERSGGRGVGG